MTRSSIKSAFILYSLAFLIQTNPRLEWHAPTNQVSNCSDRRQKENLETSLACNRPHDFLSINSTIELELITGISSTTAPHLYELAEKLRNSHYLAGINLEEEFLKISGIGAVKAAQLSKIFYLSTN